MVSDERSCDTCKSLQKFSAIVMAKEVAVVVVAMVVVVLVVALVVETDVVVAAFSFWKSHCVIHFIAIQLQVEWGALDIGAIQQTNAPRNIPLRSTPHHQQHHHHYLPLHHIVIVLSQLFLPLLPPP